MILDEAFDRLATRRRLPGAPVLGSAASDVAFAALNGRLEARWDDALRELAGCIRPVDDETPILTEGGPYPGCWVESTATISTEVLGRFAPDVVTATHLRFAAHRRPDGLLPYKVTADGPAYAQIQIVTPLARTVWEHYLTTGSREYLREMVEAATGFDAWLRRRRDTRGTGAVEAFCTFDTGHDGSPRFWGVPDRCPDGDAARFDPHHPTLPYLAPDLTANAYAQRTALAAAAPVLGQDPEPWLRGAQRALDVLWDRCFDPDRAMFYDVDARGRMVRVDSDVLLRVLACGVGDDAFFADALERDLMHTGRFLSAAGFTSVAFDDPRFDPDHRRNSWAGPVNLLSQIRAPRAFESHGRAAELATVALPLLEAVAAADRFAQCLDPWSGEPGYAESYSPAILWFVDALERLCGILPTPDGRLWFNGLTPTRLGHDVAARAVAWSRVVDAHRFELAGDDERVEVRRDGQTWLTFPRGWRVEADRAGAAVAAVGLAARPVAGLLATPTGTVPLELGPNDRVELRDGTPGDVVRIGFVAPHS
ncbi:MAG: hypothetical protein KQH57_19290 [Actinomycetales bacterium]|nr:hypothetical protein [Actinomycetales bacterium]